MSHQRLYPNLLFLLLLPLLLLFLSSSTTTSLARCLLSHRDSLLEMKAGFRPSTNASKLDSWVPGQDCCSWEGVGCDPVSGEVTDLDLSGWSISGEVSASLFNLTSLQTLNLSYNYFGGFVSSIPIPPGFERLGNLTHLNLSNTGFVGQVPGGFSRLVNLVSLDLSYAYAPTVPLKLEDPDFRTIVRNLGNLRFLLLDRVNISASGGEWCSALSVSVPGLRVLSLSNCSLSGPIDSSLSQLRSLKELRLDENDFGFELPGFLGDLSSLNFLYCSQCNLNGSLPEEIFRLRRLMSFDVSKNPSLTGNLPESFGKLSSLRSLRLSNCNFHGTVPATLGKLAQLVEVDLSFNNFSGRIPDFRSSASIREILLANNNLTGFIPPSYGKLQNLTVLDLQNNLLSGPVPSSLFSLLSLQSLQLNHNLLSGFLMELSNASSSLKILDLSHNKLNGIIPPSVFNLSGLKILTLASNNFNGTLDLNLLQNLKNFSSIDLSNNMLTVEIKDSSSFFPSISRMKLAFCNMTTFPGFLRNQSTTNHLDLSGNRLDGLIPSWIWNVGNGTFTYLNLSYNSLTGFEDSLPYLFNSSLSVIDLHSNKLKGPILLPPRLNSFIDYSNNSFGSFIPSNISDHLKSTIFFSISTNNISGSLPQSICNSTYLQVLDFSSNNLSGKLPPCLVTMDALSVLNLRGNNFSGTTLLNFKEGCKLRTLNLNTNRLNGRLPPSLRNCKELEVLDLGNNQLSGTLPSWLAGLPKLRVLVLRSNKFNGTLKHPRSSSDEHSFNMLQIIDLSSNNFTGNLSWGYFRHLKAMVLPYKNVEHQVLEISYLSLSQVYYRDTVMVTSKGLDKTLTKILTIFTSIDLSNNGFEGVIPEDLGKLKSLYVLNMSNNFLTGSIPHFLGNMSQLGSLDLSLNNLSGEIPSELISLTFLSFLNLSYNNLVGKIPLSKQFFTFTNWSFIGNPRLCGSPLKKQCVDLYSEAPYVSRPTELSWEFIFVGLGFVAGLGMVVWPLVVSKTWRTWYNKHVDKMLQAVLPSSI